MLTQFLHAFRGFYRTFVILQNSKQKPRFFHRTQPKPPKETNPKPKKQHKTSPKQNPQKRGGYPIVTSKNQGKNGLTTKGRGSYYL